uniref:RRM domain-containing protein n=1 Tax=Panagrolaimus superbus TaxID=310955 RepID=A0A914Y3J2_9BILA
MWSQSHPLLTPYLFDTTTPQKSPFSYFCDTSSTCSSETSCSDLSSSSSTSLYSLKVFIGGLPKGATKVQVLLNCQKYGVSDVEMQGHATGYCFVIFKSQACCQKFMRDCVTGSDDRFFYPFVQDVFCSKRNMVEVKPFKLVDARYGLSVGKATNAQTIFVGGLPRDTTAEQLAMKLEAKFGVVDEVAIDLDSSTMYPRGTAMVVFRKKSCAHRAIAAQTFAIRKLNQYRLIELKPFLEVDKQCSVCRLFCPAVFCASCSKVMCSSCFDANHIDSNHVKISRGTFYTLRR